MTFRRFLFFSGILLAISSVVFFLFKIINIPPLKKGGIEVNSITEGVNGVSTTTMEKVSPVSGKSNTISSKVSQSSNVSKENANKALSKLLMQLSANEYLDLALEKSFIKYMQLSNDNNIYRHIFTTLSKENTTVKLQEYLISVLAAVNTSESISLLLTIIESTSIVAADAVYSTKKSIERIGRTPEHIALVQQSFSQLNDDSLFVTDLANVIAKNAEKDNVLFLLGYINEGVGAKKDAAISSMSLLQNEKLVPELQKAIEVDNNEVTQVALVALASMGQYEAASALIQWSAKQPATSISQVEVIFNTAIARSPSTKRAIKKELGDYTFRSSDIKNKILVLTQ